MASMLRTYCYVHLNGTVAVLFIFREGHMILRAVRVTHSGARQHRQDLILGLHVRGAGSRGADRRCGLRVDEELGHAFSGWSLCFRWVWSLMFSNRQRGGETLWPACTVTDEGAARKCKWASQGTGGDYYRRGTVINQDRGLRPSHKDTAADSARAIFYVRPHEKRTFQIGATCGPDRCA